MRKGRWALVLGAVIIAGLLGGAAALPTVPEYPQGGQAGNQASWAARYGSGSGRRC